MKKILIIEDDLLVANLYRNKLCVEHYEVETAPDGESGFASIPKFQPDIIILDLMLPKMSGLELLTKVRAEADMKHIPVIVFSNTYLSNMVQQAWKAGATKCLSKATCTPKQVLDVVRSLSKAAPAEEVETKSAELSETPADEPAEPATDGDAAFQAELRNTFLTGFPAILAGSRTQLQYMVKSADENDRLKYMEELYRRIHVLTGNAAIAGEADIAQLADALEALLKELYDKPKILNASILRTVAAALDFLSVLYERSNKLDRPPVPARQKPRMNILVVDDEAISRRAVTYALEKAKLPSTAIEHPEAALKLLAENAYDIIFLDVEMPGMNGFEVCTKLRTFARNKTTPVVFVTSLSDFESRANSTISGGNDLIAKPFLFMELAVKALVYVLRGRIAKEAA